MTVRVVLADDQPLVRAALRVVIADAPDLELVGEAGTGSEAVRLAEDVHPDVVVMDIRMPGMDGIDATRLITARRPAPAPTPRTLEGITEREREVLTLVGRGMSNTEIAADLVISVATVKAYMSLTKLDARDRVQLVIIAYEAGLVSASR